MVNVHWSDVHKHLLFNLMFFWNWKSWSIWMNAMTVSNFHIYLTVTDILFLIFLRFSCIYKLWTLLRKLFVLRFFLRNWRNMSEDAKSSFTKLLLGNDYKKRGHILDIFFRFATILVTSFKCLHLLLNERSILAALQS